MGKSFWNGMRESVCHDNPRCADGALIVRGERRVGTGGKPLCPNCAKLDRANRFNAAMGPGIGIAKPSRRVRAMKENLAQPDRRGPHG
jgi:hypothetical protein